MLKGDFTMDNKNNDDEIIVSSNATLVRTYDYQPYTYGRIEVILREYYNAELISNRGYKEGRYNPYYKCHYRIVDLSTKEVLVNDVYLEDLRYFFARQGIPLYKKKKE